jgi:hypothetical protein
MTICVSVRVAEGLVMAADSTTVLRGDIVTPAGIQRQLLQSFDYATKVAQVGDMPLGVMTWGVGSIASRSIQSLVMEFEFEYAVKGRFKVETVADDLLKFIASRYDASFPTPGPDSALGLFVGGYSDGEFFSSQYSVELPVQRSWQAVRRDKGPNVPDFGANWFGATDALQRLILGFDGPSLEKLIARGADPVVVQAWVDAHDSSLPLVFDGMPLQDAIDFAEWATTVVIGRWRFGVGAQLVGGDVDIAVIRPRSFQWAQRKRWSIKDEANDRSGSLGSTRERNPAAGVPGHGQPGVQRDSADDKPPTSGGQPGARTAGRHTGGPRKPPGRGRRGSKG